MKPEPEQPVETFGLPDMPRSITLVVLAVVGGFVVWSFHTYEWIGFVGCLAVGVVLAFMAGGLVGVRLLPSLMTMVATCGLIEGALQGWQNGGLFGAALGGLLGIIIAAVVVMLPVMVTHLILVLRGIEPPVDAGENEGTTATP